VQRRQRPDPPAPSRVPGYSLTLALFNAAAVAMLIDATMRVGKVAGTAKCVLHKHMLAHGETWHHFIRWLRHAGAEAGLQALARRLTGAVLFGL
jgi:hypothetical protein